MNKIICPAFASLLTIAMCTHAYASNVSINGTIIGSTPINQSGRLYSLISAPASKAIVFERIELSEQAKAFLASPKQDNLTSFKANKSKLPASIFVGMNNVPVLDQGQHGTCVTFAITGAIDATMSYLKNQQGDDYYSELCSLELGSTLEKQSIYDLRSGQYAYPSGWDGSWGTIVLEQIKKHGLITNRNQKTQGCAGVYEYPLMVEQDHGRPMSVNDYVSNSETITPPVDFKILLNSNDAFSDRANSEVVLTQVKTALSKGHRVTFGTLLDVGRGGSNGALGTYKVEYDTWILTPEIAKDARDGLINAGHEMIIIGYDDNASVSGHKGVLTLRNSWGKDNGDNGNYYMTYDHFKMLVMEAVEIIPVAAK